MNCLESFDGATMAHLNWSGKNHPVKLREHTGSVALKSTLKNATYRQRRR